MILLPSLIRPRPVWIPFPTRWPLVRNSDLPVPDLDLHVARVALLLMATEPVGARKRLANSGVPEERIAVINGMTLEDTIDT
jgi:hypothetical protein